MTNRSRRIYDTILTALVNEAGWDRGEKTIIDMNLTREQCEMRDPKTGRTAFHYAVSCGDIKTVRWMLSQGVDPNVRDSMGLTGLHYISTWKDLELVDLMLASGSDPGARDNAGVTPVHKAALRGCIEHMERFRNYGADMDARDNRGQTPLHYAVYWRQTDSAEYLLWDAHADMDIEDDNGISPRALGRKMGWDFLESCPAPQPAYAFSDR